VKQAEAITLVIIFGVPLKMWMVNSIECEMIGTTTMAVTAATQAGSASRNACVIAP